MPADKFQRALRCCEKRGEYVQICTRAQGAEGNFIVFKTDGDDAHLMFYMRYLNQTEDEHGAPEEKSCFKKDRYSLKYLMLIARASPMSAYVTVYLVDEFVLAVRYSIGSVGEVTFCLAPQSDRATFEPPRIEPLSSTLFASDPDVGETVPASPVAVGKKRMEKAVVEKCSIDDDNKDVIVVNGKDQKTDNKSEEGVTTSMVNNGSGIKRQRRKRKKPYTQPKISGRGSIQAALAGNGNHESDKTMSGSNMHGVKKGATINDTLGRDRAMERSRKMPIPKDSTADASSSVSSRPQPVLQVAPLNTAATVLALDLEVELAMPR